MAAGSHAAAIFTSRKPPISGSCILFFNDKGSVSNQGRQGGPLQNGMGSSRSGREVGGEITWKPEELCKEILSAYPSLESTMMEKMEAVSASEGILIFSRSWAVDVGLPKHPDVACDILLVAADTFPTLYTVARDKDCSISSPFPVLEYSRNVAYILKQKLVNEGGYTWKVCVIPHVIELGSNGERKTAPSHLIYPPGYKVSRHGLEELLQALVIALLKFRSFLSDQLGCEFFNLLTVKQYEILTKNLHKSKKLFIHGLPGSGKTVVALQIIEKIKNIFKFNSREILYICESKPLCKSARMRLGEKCQTATRIDFLNGVYSEPVKHIVIDEAQSFQSKDGDWYKKAVTITQADPHKPGVLWIFLDYLQTSHTTVSDLPEPSDQEPQEWLTTGVWNATQVYNGMMHVTEMIANDRPECLKKVVDNIQHYQSMPSLSVIKLIRRMLRDNKDPAILSEQFKDIWLGNIKVLHFDDLYNAISGFRHTMLKYPQRLGRLYEQLKKQVDDPQKNQAIDAAQLCIAMIEHMYEILCFPKRFELFLEEFKKALKDVHSGCNIRVEKNPPLADSWTQLMRLDIPYEQLKRLVGEARCSHSLQGIFDVCSLKDKDEIVTVIVHKCLQYFQKGYSGKNIAILCGTEEEKKSYKHLLECEMSNCMNKLRQNVCFTTADDEEGNGIVVDSIQHFSGLERSIVFAVFPYDKSTFLVPHLLVCMVSRANLHCHVLLDHSKGFCYIASTIENQGLLLGNKQ